MRYCSKCGNELSDDQLYCPKCGHKEPFVTNLDQTSWKDFDSNKGSTENVNYDFKNQKVIKHEDKSIPKSIKVMDKINATFSVVAAVYFIVCFILSIIITVDLKKSTSSFVYILNWIGVGLFVISIIILILQMIFFKKNKNYTAGNKNVFPSMIIVACVGLGMGIGQHFLLKNGMPGVFFMFQFGINLMISTACLSKKATNKKVRI